MKSFFVSAGSVLVVATFTMAASPLAHSSTTPSKNELVSKAMGEDLQALETKESWSLYVKSKAQEFPPLTGSEKNPSHVFVDKKEIKINGETFTLGVGYRQTFIRAKIDQVAKILANPKLYKPLYGLDTDASMLVTANTPKEAVAPQGKESVAIAPGSVAPSVVPSESPSTPTSTTVPIAFEAHIFKKIPVLSNQDYILSYNVTNADGLIFARAKLKEDKNEFALRDNLTVLEPVADGTILREVSMVYILRWYLRALGPQVRSVMNSELMKITDSVRCFAEKPQDQQTDTAAETCWKTASSK